MWHSGREEAGHCDARGGGAPELTRLRLRDHQPEELARFCANPIHAGRKCEAKYRSTSLVSRS
jgi:hypothetical protein